MSPMPNNRSRSLREPFSSAAESPDKEPFSLGTSRLKTSSTTTPRRRSRHNSENEPPDDASNVKVNTPLSDSNKRASKGKQQTGMAIPGSPALPPRPPSTRASPVGLNRTSGSAQGTLGTVKKKLNWDSQSAGTDNILSVPVQDHAPDSGVKVIIRMRPLNQKEESDEAAKIALRTSNDSLSLADHHFTFDTVLGPEASQQAMFEMVGLPLVENCLAGFNSSIFAYGQTGSGKTFTMWGSVHEPTISQPQSEDRGLIPRVFERLFARIQEEEEKNSDKQLRFQCQCSLLEACYFIYGYT